MSWKADYCRETEAHEEYDHRTEYGVERDLERGKVAVKVANVGKKANKLAKRWW